MPYSNISEVPDHVKKHGNKVSNVWKSTFNNVWEKAIKDGKSKKEAEQMAFKVANSKLPKKKGAKSYLEIYEDIYNRHVKISDEVVAMKVANILAINGAFE